MASQVIYNLSDGTVIQRTAWRALIGGKILKLTVTLLVPFSLKSVVLVQRKVALNNSVHSVLMKKVVLFLHLYRIDWWLSERCETVSVCFIPLILIWCRQPWSDYRNSYLLFVPQQLKGKIFERWMAS